MEGRKLRLTSYVKDQAINTQYGLNFIDFPGPQTIFYR